VIEWKGLFANTPYSSANNKTQDDAVIGMQDTIYVTGPGYGGYSANVRIHNESGAVVALIPVSGGGGTLSAPAPVRILDDSTAYSYSLEVVRGVVPSDDADKIAIRIVGGASKRYPGQVSTLSDGSTSFAGPALFPGASTRKASRVAAWAPHPGYVDAGTSSLTNATGQINLLAPVKKFTHIQVELANNAATAYSGIKNVIAALSSNVNNATPSVGADVTGNPRTGWVSVDTAPEVPARPGASYADGLGYWLSGKVYMPSSHVVSELRAPVICLRYWQQLGGATFWWFSDRAAEYPVAKSDRMGGLAWARRITGRATNADCVAGTSANADAPLNAAADLTASVFGRVYFWDGDEMVGSTGINQTLVEVFGASTMSGYMTFSGTGEPWIGLAGGALRSYGITLGHAARPGATSAQILASAKARLDMTPAHYAIYAPFVSNDTDPFDEAASVLQVQRFLEFAAYAESKSVSPIAVIMCHNFGTTDQIAQRERSIQVIKDSGYSWIDVREWMGRADSPNLLRPDYTTDGTHFSALGESVMASEFPSRLLRAVALTPRLR
jgi:hypothetical protein